MTVMTVLTGVFAVRDDIHRSVSVRSGKNPKRHQAAALQICQCDGLASLWTLLDFPTGTFGQASKSGRNPKRHQAAALQNLAHIGRRSCRRSGLAGREGGFPFSREKSIWDVVPNDRRPV